MVIERYNSEHADSGWKPPQDRAAAFEQPREAASAGIKPEGKKERKKRKAGQVGDNPLFAEAPQLNAGDKSEAEKRSDSVPPLLGEGVIWQSDDTLKPDDQEHDRDHDLAGEPAKNEKPLTPEQIFQMQQELQDRTSAIMPDIDAEAKAATETDQVANRRFQTQPQIQHQAHMEDGPQDMPGEDESLRTDTDAAEAHVSRSTSADMEAEPLPGYGYAAAEEAPEAAPPILPPDPAEYVRQEAFYNDAPVREAPAAVPVQGKYESDTPPGLQRTTADVSRAAWTGTLAGWWLGRRGKRKAVEAAHKAGRAEGLAAAGGRLEAEPLHYPESETDRRTVMPMSVEAKPAVSPARPVEASTAVVASVAALEKLRPRTNVEAPRTVKSAASRATERVVARPEYSREVPAERAELAMSKRELLKVAKDIKVEGVSLKEIFAAQRIDEEGLRAVVREHLRGGDVRGRLSREITAKEMSFEQDPLFRRGKRGEWLERTSEKIGNAVNKGVDAARDLAGERGAQLAASTSRTAHKAGQLMSDSAKQAQHDLIDTSHTADWVGVTAVVVVWSAILLLVLW